MPEVAHRYEMWLDRPQPIGRSSRGRALRYLIIFAIAASLAGSALARAMKVGDLGPAASRQACMQRAVAVIQDYIDRFGGQSVSRDAENPDDWAVYGWGLRPGVTDLVISCPVVGPQTNAFFAIHADGPEGVENADLAASRIEALWNVPR